MTDFSLWTQVEQFARHYFPITSHTWIFFVVLCILLLAPLVFERLRIPRIVGLIVAGIAVGEHGFNLLARDNSFELFGQVGLFYIMFNAGLTMDVGSIRSNFRASIFFSVLTFLIPFSVGVWALQWYPGYPLPTALLLSSILGCHTLLAFPIVSRYGLLKHPATTVAVGGTLLSLLAALLVLAITVQTYSITEQGDAWGAWLVVAKCILLFVGAYVALPPIIRYFFRHTPDSVMQYIFVLSVIFFCAAMSDLLALEGILGAFLAGIVLGRHIPNKSPLMNRIGFVGDALFIPYFLIGVGMLINVRLIFEEMHTVLVGSFIVFIATATKAIAAYATSGVFRMGRDAGTLLFGLSEPHAAGALAMVLVGTETLVAPDTPLVSADVFNVFVMLLLFSCLISTFATEYAARRLAMQAQNAVTPSDEKHRIMIALANEEAVESLVSTALLMRSKHSTEPLMGISIVLEEKRDNQTQTAQRILDKARNISAGADVEMLTHRRISVNVSTGIIHYMQETGTSDLLMGLHRQSNYTDKFYGTIMQDILHSLVRQIVILRLQQPINTLRKVHVLVPAKAEYEVGFEHWLDNVCRIAQELSVRMAFYSYEATQPRIVTYMAKSRQNVSYDLLPAVDWSNLVGVAGQVLHDELLVIVQARRGTLSYHHTFEHVPGQLQRYFTGKNFMLVFPNQFGEDF